jgi:hypothetical protein
MKKREYSCDKCDVFVTIRGDSSSLDKLKNDAVDCPICGDEMDKLD